MSCIDSAVRLDEFAMMLRMAMFSSEAHPGPINLNRRTLFVLSFVFHTQSAVIGAALHVISVYTCPESTSNFLRLTLLESDVMYPEEGRISSNRDIF